MTDREALQIAFNALVSIDRETPYPIAKHAIKCINTAFNTQAQPEQEPVAWMYDFLNSDNRDEVIRNWVTQDIADIEREKGFNVRPLYTALQSKPWVSLTEEEIELYDARLSGSGVAREIDAKLKEKSGG